MEWLKARLAEHSTQVALGADLAAIGAALQGTLSWQNALTIVGGSLLTVLIPASKPNA